MTKYSFVECFAGCGGLSTGLILSGLKPLMLNDINKDCCNTLKLNHENVEIKCCSILDLSFDEYKNIDLFACGINCQPFSSAGKRNGFADERGKLFFNTINIIHKLKPKMFLIENVKGLINHDKGKTIETIITKLQDGNVYDVQYKLLNSVDFCVPQKRERVIIVGVLKKYNVKFEYPEKEEKRIVLSSVLGNSVENENECYKYPEKKIKLFKLIQQGQCWINLPENLQKEYLGKSYNSGGGKRGILRKLSMNEPSLTLLCSPSQKQTERCHPLFNRPLSIREYALIQTFPENYIFTGSLSSKYRQIGNAVPVELGKRIGNQIIKCLDECYSNLKK